DLGYGKRLAMLTLLDSCIVLFSIYASVILLDENFQVFQSKIILATSISLLLFHHFFAFIYRFYHRAWEYASIGELKVIIKGITFSILLCFVVQFVLFQQVTPKALLIT